MKFFLVAVVFVTGLMSQTPNPSGSIAGRWHLIQGSDDEINIPNHRVDLVFREQNRGEQNALSGAVINRTTGEDIPLAGIRFNGNVLTLEMGATNQNSTPAILTMTWKGNKFEGHWMRGTTEVGPTLKLVRF
jgi:hypothetical protein